MVFILGVSDLSLIVSMCLPNPWHGPQSVPCSALVRLGIGGDTHLGWQNLSAWLLGVVGSPFAHRFVFRFKDLTTHHPTLCFLVPAGTTLGSHVSSGLCLSWGIRLCEIFPLNSLPSVLTQGTSLPRVWTLLAPGEGVSGSQST